MAARLIHADDLLAWLAEREQKYARPEPPGQTSYEAGYFDALADVAKQVEILADIAPEE